MNHQLLLLILTNITYWHVFTGYNQSCYYIKNIQKLYCWGSNRLGESDIPSRFENTYLQFLSIGRMYVCATFNLPTVQKKLHCWGDSEHGKTEVPEAYSSSIEYVKAGDWHTCALSTESEFTCWGLDTHGQCSGLHDFTTLYNFGVRGYITMVIGQDGIKLFGDKRYFSDREFNYSHDLLPNYEIALGYKHYCSIILSLECFGDDEMNQLKPNKTEKISTIESYANHSCSVYVENDKKYVDCWGDNKYKQLNLPQVEDNYNVVATGLNHTCISISYLKIKCFGTAYLSLNTVPLLKHIISHAKAGGEFNCILIGGEMRCFGKNKYNVLNPPDTFNQGNFSSGFNHNCATRWDRIQSKETIHCWGLKDNYFIDVPAIVNDNFYQNYDMDSGYKFNCVIKARQAKAVTPNGLICWGTNEHGQCNITPTVPLESSYVLVKLGIAHACTITGASELFCFGMDNKGQASVPSQAKTNLKTVAVGYYHTCAVNHHLQLWCWGFNGNGQTDLPESHQYRVFTVYSGGNHNCALNKMSEVYCWGSNKYGQLEMFRSGKEIYLILGEKHTCAVKRDGKMKCYGDNSHGQLNVNTVMNS